MVVEIYEMAIKFIWLGGSLGVRLVQIDVGCVASLVHFPEATVRFSLRSSTLIINPLEIATVIL